MSTRAEFFLSHEAFDGQTIAVESESLDGPFAARGNYRVVAEFLTTIHVADVNLDDGSADGTDAVEQRNARVGVSTGIENNTVVGEASLLHFVDELAFDVALVVLYLDIGESLAEPCQIIVHRFITIDGWFTSSQEVKVRAIDDDYFHITLKLLIFAKIHN